MKKYLLLIALGGLLVPAAAFGEILTAFSDQGVPGSPQGFNPINTFPNPKPATVVYTTAPLAGAPEGYSAFQTTDQNVPGAGWAIAYPAPQDLSRFNNGEFRFWVYSSTSDIEIQLQNSNGPLGLLMDTSLALLNWNPAIMTNQWVLMRIGMAPVNLTNVQHPGVFFANSAPAVFYIDNVHFITATSAPNFNVTVKNRSDNSLASQITWTSTPSTWTIADQYIGVEVDATIPTWGIQVYTDNTSSAASPKFTGPISSFTATPAGLVDTADTTITLPLAWATRAEISTITVTAADPNNTKDLNSFQWSIFEDKAQVAVPISSATAFVNGDPYIAVRNNFGIHFAQGGSSNDPNHFGAEDPPFRIYLETNFGTSLAQTTYKTNTLTIELFYL